MKMGHEQEIHEAAIKGKCNDEPYEHPDIREKEMQ
jgi:hypothetical protein